MKTFQLCLLGLLAAGGCDDSVVRAVAPTDGGQALDASPDGAPADSGAPDGGEAFGSAVFLAAAPDPVGVAVDAQSVYVSSYSGGGGVLRVAKTGGAATVLATGAVYGIAVDDTSVYYTAPDTGTLWRVDKAGGAPFMLAGGLQDFPSALAVDATDVYVVGAPGPVVRVSKTGVVTTLVTTPSTTVALDAAALYFTTSGAQGTVQSVPKAGGAPTVLAAGQPYPRSIAVSSGRVYWADDGQALDMLLGGLNATSAGGGPSEALVVSPAGSEGPLAVTADATGAFFADEGTVKRAVGGEIQPLGAIPDVEALVVDTSGVYCASRTGMAIYRIPRLP